MSTEVYTNTKDNRSATVYKEDDGRYSVVTVRDTAIIGEDSTSIYPDENISREVANLWIYDGKLLDQFAINFWKTK